MLHSLIIFAVLLVLSTKVSAETSVECISRTFEGTFTKECRAKVEAYARQQMINGHNDQHDLLCSALGSSLECARNVIAERCGRGAANDSFLNLVKLTIKEKSPELANCPALATKP